MPAKGQLGRQQQTNKGVKKRMMQRDYDAKEWALVGKLDEIAEIGATKAVEAGRSPGRMGATGFEDGPMYIWALVRGDPRKAREGEEDEPADAGVYAIDGSCRACQFPMTAGKWFPGNNFGCVTCGTKYNLETGEVVDFMPKENPVQWAAAMANGDKPPQTTASLPTRVSRSGNVYVRLPDNTIME